MQNNQYKTEFNSGLDNDIGTKVSEYRKSEPSIKEYSEIPVPRHFGSLEDDRPRSKKKTHKSGGCGCSCRRFIFGGCLLFILSIVLLIVIVWQKPPFVWEPIKDWLNAGLTATPAPNLTLVDALTSVEEQANSFTVGANNLIISEEQLRVFINDKFSEEKMNVDIQEGSIKVYWNLEQDSHKPVWAVINIMIDENGKPYFARVGTERISIPSFITDLVTGIVFSILNISGGQDISTSLTNIVLPVTDGIEVSKISINDDSIIFEIVVRSGLEGLFSQ